MQKSFATDDHAALIEASGGRATTFFERAGSGAHITKSASDAIGKADVQAHMPPDDHFGVHLISIGAEEDFGYNRNADSTSRRALDLYHGTFEKFANVYREHKNKDPQKRIGVVKLAKVNPKMHRGELIVWVEKDKAPDMYKKAKAGEELSWSMSMKLPADECSCCRKKSRTTADYCSHLKDNMSKWIPGFEKFAYARNEENVKYFDISEVKRRADRIATYLGYYFPDSDMAKAASADSIITGAQWAEYQFGPSVATPFSPWEELTLEKLASAAEFIQHADADTLTTLARMAPQDLTPEQVEILAQPDFRSVGGELAKRAMIISFPTFASIVTGKTREELEKVAEFNDTVAAKLPTLLADMLRDGGCGCGEEVADAVAPDEVGCSFSPGKDAIDRLMAEAGGSMGMDQENTANRAVRITIIKRASLSRPTPAAADPYYEGLVSAYGHYLVKAAHQAKDLPGVSERSFFRSIAAGLIIRPFK
jgi:hypothetical protein